MIKVLYAAGSGFGSYLQLQKFKKCLGNNQNIDLKIAAPYFLAGNLTVDFNIDALFNFYTGDLTKPFKNTTHYQYALLIKQFNPDLILSDLDITTSMIGLELNIPVWQVSAALMYYAINNKVKYNLKLYKQYSHLFRHNYYEKQCLSFIIKNSDRRLVVSPFYKLKHILPLKKNFEYIQSPYIKCENKIDTDYLIVSSHNHKKLLERLDNSTSKIIFTKSYYETIPNTIIRNIYNEQEYELSLARSNCIVCQGETSLLSDALQNQKKIIIVPEQTNLECLTNHFLIEYLAEKVGADWQEIQFNMSSNVQSLNDLI